MKQFQLLCTFSTEKLVTKKVEEIKRKFEIQHSAIFILQSTANKNDWYITYNALLGYEDNYKDLITNTINIHRNKSTNTLYTINALNEVIKNCNNGVLDIDYRIDWDNYKNSILLYRNESLLIVKTKLDGILKWSSI